MRRGAGRNCAPRGTLLRSAHAGARDGGLRRALGLSPLRRASLRAAPPRRPGTFDAVVCARFLMHVPAASRPRVFRTLAGLTHGPLVATVCHPYTVKSLGRSVRRWLGRPTKRSPRLTRRALAAEVEAAGLQLERGIPLLPPPSQARAGLLPNRAPPTR